MIEFHGHFREHFEPLIWESEPWERVADLSTISESSMNGDRNDREIKSAPKWCGECCHEKLHASEVEGLYFLSRLWGCPKSYGRIWSLGSFSNLWSCLYCALELLKLYFFPWSTRNSGGCCIQKGEPRVFDPRQAFQPQWILVSLGSLPK